MGSLFVLEAERAHCYSGRGVVPRYQSELAPADTNFSGTLVIMFDVGGVQREHAAARALA